MPNLHFQTSNTYDRAIADYQNAKPYASEKENQCLLYGLAASHANPEKHAVAQGMLSGIALLSLISNSVCVLETRHPRGITRSDADYPLRLPQSSDVASSSDVLNNLSIISADIGTRMHGGLAHLSHSTTGLANDVFTLMSKTIEKYDFIPLLPGTSAHVIPGKKKSTSPPPQAEKDAVNIQKLDYSCAQERNTLSFAQVLRQIGKTLKTPITELARESKTIHYFNILRAGCPSAEDTRKLTAITLRVDNIISTILSFVPYANRVTLVQNVGGSLLQVIADDIEGRAIENDEVEDIIEQINFLAKSTVDISPTETNGSGRVSHLEFPENIYAENNKIFTSIENKNWQLVFKENRYFAISHTELREVRYSRAERKWVFSHDSKYNPVTGTLLQRLHRLGPDSMAQRGGLTTVAQDYFVEPNELEVYIKGDARLSSDGLKRVADAGVDQPNRPHGTLDKFYDSLELLSDNMQKLQQEPQIQQPDTAVSNSHIDETEQQLTDLFPNEPDVHVPPVSPVKSIIITPEEAPKMEERLLKNDDPLPHTSQYRAAETNDAPSKALEKQRTKATPIRPTRKELKKMVRQIAEMGKTGIREAGGLKGLAKQNNVPLSILKRHLHADGTLTETGKHLVSSKSKKAVPKPDQSLASENTVPLTSPWRTTDVIEPHKGVAALITRRTTGAKITLEGNIDGIKQPLVYNLEQDVFYPAVRAVSEGWIRGSDTPYIAIEGSEALSVLSEIQRNRVVSHEQRTATLKALGSELDLVSLEKHMAENPPRAVIPHKISSIWVGKNNIPDHLMKNIGHNARLAKSGRNPFAFTLYLSDKNRAAFSHNIAALEKYAPNVRIVRLEQTAFYQQFKQSKYYEQYHDALGGNAAGATNFASASDVVRFQLMKEEGGIYMDMDDKLISSPNTISLMTTPEGFILHPPMHNQKLGMSFQYPTSVFGTHKNNPSLEKISEEIFSRYQMNKDIYSSRPPYDNRKEFDVYAKRISYISGPDAFDSALNKAGLFESQIPAAQKMRYFPLEKIKDPTLRNMLIPLYEKDLTPLKDIIRVGSENSWTHSRR